MVGVFDGPLCLGLSSAEANVDGDWEIATSADGKPVVRPSGRPAIIGEKGEADVLLRPIADDWQSPDLHNPHRIRVLFKTKVIPGA